MNCAWVQQNVTLYLYNELPDDARFELEQHAKRCQECAAVIGEFQGFHQQLDALFHHRLHDRTGHRRPE